LGVYDYYEFVNWGSSNFLWQRAAAGIVGCFAGSTWKK